MDKKIPEIRFKGFDEEWTSTTVGKISDRVVTKNTDNAVSLPLTASAQYGLVAQEEFFNSRIAAKDTTGYYVISKGEFAYNRSSSDGSPYGAVKRLDKYDTGVLSTLYLVFKLKDSSISSDYLVQYFSSAMWHNHIAENAAEGARNHGLLNISSEDFLNTPIGTPKDLDEQEKIGMLFKALDRLIRSLEIKLEKLKNIKQSLLNQMFTNGNRGGYEPLIRFKDYNGDWKVITLGEISTKVVEKNISMIFSKVFTNSAEYGIIDQKDYFDRSIANQDSLRGYYIVDIDSYVYNPRISATAPVGPINRNKTNAIGLISPLYYVFNVGKNHVNYDFLDYFFKGTGWHEFMYRNGNSGARSDRFSIGADDFSKMPIVHPTDADEEINIGHMFNNLNIQITSLRSRIDHTRNIKQSLLQKMFVN